MSCCIMLHQIPLQKEPVLLEPALLVSCTHVSWRGLDSTETFLQSQLFSVFYLGCRCSAQNRDID
uniref:Uncharacterized protein n=1 Tax=Anguilla anguilla TaxID=7936 RepID=A0A0E9RCI2_ANGAN